MYGVSIVTTRYRHLNMTALDKLTTAATAPYPAISVGKVAVITGGAGGIGLAAAKRFASFGMHVVVADLPTAPRDAASVQIAAAVRDNAKSVTSAQSAPATVHAVATDVSQFESVVALADIAQRLGNVTVLMNNAGIGARPLHPGKASRNGKRCCKQICGALFTASTHSHLG